MQRKVGNQARALALVAPAYLNRTSLVLALICAASVLIYSVLLLETVAHAASQTSAQRQIGALTAKLGDLEAQYLSDSQALTQQKALEMGYVLPDQSKTTTVYATAATQALSLGGQ